MSMKIYGNSEPVRLVAEMIKKKREPHSIIIHGDKGLGKKTLAKYIAGQLLCEEQTGTPCGKCKACRMLEHDSHPDFIVAKPNANGNYIVDESIRPIVSDASILPNEGDLKVYVIPDLDMSVSTAVQVQNIMLKLIEEPPAHVAVILTARSKEIFLPTIISRVLSLGMIRVSDEESRQYLTENFPDKTEDEIFQAVLAGRGNIGRCEEYLNKTAFFSAVIMARSMANAACRANEYEMLKALFQADGKKAVLREGVFLFSEIVRDACVIRLGDNDRKMSVSCDYSGARNLAQNVSATNLSRLYDVLWEYINKIDANCNLTLTSNSLAGQICGFLK
ncbi:MAG: ATP-binding protein [Hominimerdicola sp.]